MNFLALNFYDPVTAPHLLNRLLYFDTPNAVHVPVGCIRI